MNIQWTTAALLSSVLIVGCGDRGTENSRELDDGAAPTVGTVVVGKTARLPETSARVDNSAVRDTQPGRTSVATT